MVILAVATHKFFFYLRGACKENNRRTIVEICCIQYNVLSKTKSAAASLKYFEARSLFTTLVYLQLITVLK